MSHYVYRIDRPSTGQFYIGIRSCSCWPTGDTRYMGSGTRIRRIPNEELVKTILVIVQTREEAARIEAALVGPDQVADPMCLNLCGGGDGGTPFISESTREKMRQARQGSKHSDETRRKISQVLQGNTRTKGRKLSQQHREKISKASQSLWGDSEFRRKVVGNRIGHRHSPETRRKMSETRKRWWAEVQEGGGKC